MKLDELKAALAEDASASTPSRSVGYDRLGAALFVGDLVLYEIYSVNVAKVVGWAGFSPGAQLIGGYVLVELEDGTRLSVDRKCVSLHRARPTASPALRRDE